MRLRSSLLLAMLISGGVLGTRLLADGPEDSKPAEPKAAVKEAEPTSPAKAAPAKKLPLPAKEGAFYKPIPPVDPKAPARALVKVTQVTEQQRKDFNIRPFYTKVAMLDTLPIIGSEQASDYSILEAAYTIDHMLEGRTKVYEALQRSRVKLAVMAVTEYTMDIPENASLGRDGAYYDRRARGLGNMPLAICAEENVLNLRGDPYNGENITIHEFSHIVASAMQRVDPAWWGRLREAFRDAMSKKLWTNSYATTNAQEYWAEGVQSWFDCNAKRNDQYMHNGIWNREKLKDYDPGLAKLCEEVFGENEWKYQRTTERKPEEVAHLEGLDRGTFPVFSFNNSPRIQAANAEGRPINLRSGPQGNRATAPPPSGKGGKAK